MDIDYASMNLDTAIKVWRAIGELHRKIAELEDEVRLQKFLASSEAVRQREEARSAAQERAINNFMRKRKKPEPPAA